MHKKLKRVETAFDMFLDTDVIQNIVEARWRVRFRTIEPSPSLINAKAARCYNGVGFDINVFLRCHVDKYLTMWIVQVRMDGIFYQSYDTIVCYFCFSRIRIAVGLQPGDFLLFNPPEPHSILCHCNKDGIVYCISSYLKTQVVRLNNNSNTVI